MQTFLPHEDFYSTARDLDRLRLGKQRVETLQLMKSLTEADPRGWVNHPARRMWIGRECWLMLYQIAICTEWGVVRGYRDTCLEKTWEMHRSSRTWGQLCQGRCSETRKPAWLGDTRLHSSHRAALLHKDPDHYGRLGWLEEPRLDYYWPDY